jgi:hypothetical protein
VPKGGRPRLRTSTQPGADGREGRPTQKDAPSGCRSPLFG